MKTLFFGLTILFSISLINSQLIGRDSKTEFQNGWKSISESRYLIQYPETWDLDKSGQNGTSFIVLANLTSQEDMFRENVNLIIQDLTGMKINLGKYVEISEGQIKTLVKNGKILESKTLNANRLEFHKIIYTGEQGIYNLKFEQYYWVKNNTAYVLTFTCEINQFDKYREIGERILNSFILK